MHEELLDNLPHGKEFRFIDSIEELRHGHSAVGTYRVKGNEEFLKGHFPNNPFLPGVILVESVAQLAGIVIQSKPGMKPLDNLRLCAIRNAKIKGTATPGEVLRISVELTGSLEALVQAKGTVSVHDKMILSVEVTLSGALNQ